MMARILLILAVLIPVVCFLLVKYQDADFVLMIYEVIGENPAVVLRAKLCGSRELPAALVNI